MLFIGDVCFNGDGHRLQSLDDLQLIGELGLDGFRLEDIQVIVQLNPDSKSNDKIRNQSHMNQRDALLGESR